MKIVSTIRVLSWCIKKIVKVAEELLSLYTLPLRHPPIPAALYLYTWINLKTNKDIIHTRIQVKTAKELYPSTRSPRTGRRPAVTGRHPGQNGPEVWRGRPAAPEPGRRLATMIRTFTWPAPRTGRRPKWGEWKCIANCRGVSRTKI